MNLKKLCFFLLFLMPLIGATTPPPFTQNDEEAFYEQLQDELQDSEKRLHNMVMEKANNRSIFTHRRQVLLDSARSSMQAKYTLYANFHGTSSIQSPEVRKKLLDIFESDEVTTDDLQDLQTAVFQWQRTTRRTP